MAITTNDIHAVADKIDSEGGKPTLAAIRKALGGGSFTTISEAMKSWTGKQVQVVQHEPAPEAITQRLEVLGAEVWAIATELATARLQSEREALEQAKQQIEAERQEAIALADALSTELEQAKAEAIAKADAVSNQISEMKFDLEEAKAEAVENAKKASELQGQVDAYAKIIKEFKVKAK